MFYLVIDLEMCESAEVIGTKLIIMPMRRFRLAQFF